MRAEIDIIQTGIQHICSVRRPKLLQDALCHQRCLTNTLLPLNHQQAVIPVDFIHHTPDEIESYCLHPVQMPFNQCFHFL
jgi:hypothetical protein